MNSHRALTRERKTEVNLSLADTPICGPFDVMIAPSFVGLCGTDIQIYRGAIHSAANVLGTRVLVWLPRLEVKLVVGFAGMLLRSTL
jgi:threonine dehydrogenase-like Zn-dependent dehydrogenase